MTDAKIFDNISEKDLAQMLACFKAKRKKFAAGSPIVTYAGADNKLGILISGEADLVRYDYEGYRNILEHLLPGDVFGQIFVPPYGADELTVVGQSKCEVLLIEYRHIVKRCPSACPHHSRMVDNLLQIMGEKSKRLNMRIEVLSQRTLRAKLLTYFRMQAKQSGSKSFTLPFTLASLADYLFVDRSAMLREMKAMREEGILISRGKKIELP